MRSMKLLKAYVKWRPFTQSSYFHLYTATSSLCNKKSNMTDISHTSCVMVKGSICKKLFE